MPESTTFTAHSADQLGRFSDCTALDRKTMFRLRTSFGGEDDLLLGDGVLELVLALELTLQRVRNTRKFFLARGRHLNEKKKKEKSIIDDKKTFAALLGR